jgi:hypothetical protein
MMPSGELNASFTKLVDGIYLLGTKGKDDG